MMANLNLNYIILELYKQIFKNSYGRIDIFLKRKIVRGTFPN